MCVCVVGLAKAQSIDHCTPATTHRSVRYRKSLRELSRNRPRTSTCARNSNRQRSVSLSPLNATCIKEVQPRSSAASTSARESRRQCTAWRRAGYLCTSGGEWVRALFRGGHTDVQVSGAGLRISESLRGGRGPRWAESMLGRLRWWRPHWQLLLPVLDSHCGTEGRQLGNEAHGIRVLVPRMRGPVLLPAGPPPPVRVIGYRERRRGARRWTHETRRASSNFWPHALL